MIFSLMLQDLKREQNCNSVFPFCHLFFHCDEKGVFSWAVVFNLKKREHFLWTENLCSFATTTKVVFRVSVVP